MDAPEVQDAESPPSYNWDALAMAYEENLQEIYGTFDDGSAVPWEVRKALGRSAVELANGQREFVYDASKGVKESTAKENFDDLSAYIESKSLKKRWLEHVKKIGLKKAYADAAGRMDKEIDLGRLMAASQTDVAPAEVQPPPPIFSVPTLAPPKKADKTPDPNPLKRGAPVNETAPVETKRAAVSAATPAAPYVPSAAYEDFVLQDSKRRSEEYYQQVFGAMIATSKPRPVSPWNNTSALPRARVADAIVRRARTMAPME